MKKINRFIFVVVLWFGFCFYSVTAQNICPNPGFEQLTACPAGSGEINKASPWNGAGVSSDLFNFCHLNTFPANCNNVSVPANFAGISPAHGGSSYAGFFTKRAVPDSRTYLQAPLTTPMVPNNLYRVAAYFKRSSLSGYATNNIGISFSTAAISQTGNLFIAITPQLKIPGVIADTTAWTGYTGYYVAAGGEAYITIGNFSSDAATSVFNFTSPLAACVEINNAAFYYADDFSVVSITEQLSVSGDTTICAGQTTTLTGMTNTTGWWSEATSPTDTLTAINNMLQVTPAQTTTYLWNGVQNSITVTVTVGNAPVFSLPSDTTLCEGEQIILNAASPNSTYMWSNGATTSSISVSDSGTYMVTVTNGFCARRDTFLLTIIPVPVIPLPPQITICRDNNEYAQLNAGTGLGYLWSPTNDTVASITVTDEGIYSVVVTHASGCTRTASVEVLELCEATLFFPLAFTPNSDGKNDLFYGNGLNFKDYKIRIFNRWGQLLHESNVPGIGGAWNGSFNNREAPAGLYSFIASYSIEVSPSKRRIKTRKGWFHLIR